MIIRRIANATINRMRFNRRKLVVGLALLAVLSLTGTWVVLASTANTLVIFTSMLDEDFLRNENVPVYVVQEMSSPFLPIDDSTITPGTCAIRSYCWNGDPQTCPFDSVVLGLEFGDGAMVTYRFALNDPNQTIVGGKVGFQIWGAGNDGGTLYKYVSSDGDNWQQVGDASDAEGFYRFPAATGSNETYLRLQTGTEHGWYDGVYIDNIHGKLRVQ